MRLLSTAAPSYVGISISNTALCVVALCNHKGGQINSYQLTHYGLSELSPGQVVDNQIIDTEQMGQTIAQLIQQLHLTATQAAIAIPQALTLTKTVQMSAWLLDVEIEAQICIDADQHIPYPIAEASFDFEVLGPAIADGSDNSDTYDSYDNSEATDVISGTELVDVLLVVTLTRDVEQLTDALTFGSLNTALVEVDTHAIERAFQFIYWQLPTQVPVVALVDIGQSRTTVYVANQGVFVYQCEQLFGGAQLDERLQSEYQLDDEQINRIKSDESAQIAGITDADIYQYVTDFTQALVSTIKQALHAYFQPQHLASSQNNTTKTNSAAENDSNQDTDSYVDNSANTDSAPQIEQVILCGGSAALQQLDALLQQQLGLPVTIANPFAAMALSPTINAEQLSKDAPRLMSACGLSMRSCQQAKHTRKRRLWRR
ncbi:type IV pilus assembly protein PilM [Psychrobacter sp. FDAARGOS_221]|uniref:type IV pilus assembly protein PilM n=1 Tax=Psychrobacter sp. FDAARGOS_221 TaxID=1975705 RepID=UPI000BB5495B|nr:type IV pilus assembly protein PilM [Psychrobacter sp. FDAARGOS_221]PNK60361.1 hypothetical protein A6J60_005390 [Psychrobacter sp. FDAARGOS_221]